MGWATGEEETMISRFEFGAPRLTRRGFLAQSAIAMAAATLPYGRAFADTGKQEFVEANTAYGRVRGVKSGNLTTFKGIPYAGSASGANRFKAAPPLPPWAGVRDALQLGAPSMQPGGQRHGEPPSDENCLFLNVWTPHLMGANVQSCSTVMVAALPADRPVRPTRMVATWLEPGTWLWWPPIID